MKVLICDDNTDFAVSLAPMLTPWAEPLSATTLADGVNKAAAADIVLLDLNLPDSAGLETVKTFIHKTDLPVIVVTGESNDVGIEAVRLGAQDYFVKTDISASALQKAILYAVERVKNRRLAVMLATEQKRSALLETSMATVRELVDSLDKYVIKLRTHLAPTDVMEAVEQ